jgi:sec-independent protein translocase protein TatC
MTFGEHLEELRSALFKALLWLVGGFLLGICFAKPTVHFIQMPLEKALEGHYKSVAKKQLETLGSSGIALPGSTEQLTELVASQNLLPEEVYLQPGELLEQVRKTYDGVRSEREHAIEQFRTAVPLLRRLELPAGDPQRKLSREERSQVAAAVRLIEPVAATGEDSSNELTQDDLDRIAREIDRGRELDEEDLPRVATALRQQEDRFQKELGRVAEATQMLDRTQLPALESHDELRRGDLARFFLWRPIEKDPRIRATALGAPEAFVIFVKAALLVGVLVASPGIFWSIWSFVGSGLYFHERRFVYVFGPFSLVLFFLGAALVFAFVFRFVLQFLFAFNEWLGIGIDPRITEWLGFVLILPLGFGIAFQLPLVMLFLERIGIFDVKAYLSKWRIAVLVIAVLSMLLTPADPGSMLLMFVPLTALYFGGILLCRFMPRSRSPYDEEVEKT